MWSVVTETLGTGRLRVPRVGRGIQSTADCRSCLPEREEGRPLRGHRKTDDAGLQSGSSESQEDALARQVPG